MSAALPAGLHGGDGRVVALAAGLDPDTVLDLSMSCNPFAPDPAPLVVAAVAAGALGRYPDERDRSVAAAALAETIGVDPARVLVTSGGAEAIALVATELGQGWVDNPDFSLYARHLRALVPGAPRFRSDPHNPTGLLAGDEERAAVWDEAFYPLATGRWTRGAGSAPRSAPAVVVGSLTKVLGCPGLRLGYVVVPEDDGQALGLPGLAHRLAERQPRWSVATPALAVLPALVAQADIAVWAAQIASQRSALVEVLRRHGFEPEPSDANFVLVHGAAGLRDGLVPHGVVVRDCASFGLPNSVRIAVPGDDGLDRLDRALGRVVGRMVNR
jgi:histidinol-phosphate/aromatic aminotransferase/cobyric acid decarboxylase-like protein